MNIGTISGGMGKNIVPESIILAGEVRSLDHERANRQMKEIIETFNRDAKKAGGLAACRWQELCKMSLCQHRPGKDQGPSK